MKCASVFTADPSETTENLSHSALFPKKRESESFFFFFFCRRFQGQNLSGYRLSPSAARLLLSRIGHGGFKNGDRAAEKITQVGSILEEKTIAEEGSNLKEKN